VTLVPFVFGKVPARGDFVRAGHRTPLLDELDGWLQRGLLAHRAPLPADGPPVAFVLGRPGAALLGVFVPSRDRAGRAFPLVVGASADAPRPVTGRDVTAWAPLLTASAACAAGVAADALAPDEALPLLDVPPAPTPEAFLGLHPATVFGGEVEGTVRALPDALRPFRMAGAAPRYGLGLPLPADPAVRTAAAGFWLDAVTRVAGPRVVTTLLWAADGPHARLALFLGPPTPDALGYLLAARSAEGVYDLDAAASPASPTGAPTLRALLDRL